MKKHVPLISTRTVGPLGLVHLPRLWLKMRLSTKGMLDDEYRAGEGGFDGLLLEALGLDVASVIAYMQAAHPSYLDFEDWVRENANSDSLTQEGIEMFNDRILSFPKPEPSRTESLEFIGLPQSDKEWLGTDLNDLDDWHGIHLALLEE